MPACLIIASNFPPIQSAGVYRTLRLVKYLPDFDWDLRVLTLCPNSLPNRVSIDLALTEQIPTDVPVLRVPARFPIEKFNQLTGRNKSNKSSNQAPKPINENVVTRPKANTVSLFQRLKDRITMPWMTPDRMVGWVAPAAKAGLRWTTKHSSDVIYSSGPPWSNHLVAGRIAAVTKLPWVADFRDPWGGNAFRPDRSANTWSGRKHRALEAHVYRDANQIIFNTDRSRIDAIERMGDFLSDKSVVIPNGFDPEHFSRLKPSIANQKTESEAPPLHMLHTGAFYGKRNVDSLLAAIGDLKQTGDLSSQNFRLELIGRIRDHERQLIEKYSIGDLVALHAPIPHQECLSRLAAADVLLLVQTEAPLCIPGKLFEYIAIGKKMFTLASDGATADLVNSHDLGLCIDPADGPGINSALLNLLHQHGNPDSQTGDETVRQQYDGRNQMRLFDDVLRRAVLT